jgi:hypothetical protein
MKHVQNEIFCSLLLLFMNKFMKSRAFLYLDGYDYQLEICKNRVFFQVSHFRSLCLSFWNAELKEDNPPFSRSRV